MIEVIVLRNNVLLMMLQYFLMRIFLHLKGFTLSKIISHQQLKILKKTQNKTHKFTILFSVKTINTTDELLSIVANRLSIPPEDLILKIIIKHQTQYHRINVIKGFNYAIYCGLLGHSQTSLNFQLELQALFIGQKTVKDDLNETDDQSNYALSETFNNEQNLNTHQIYHYSNQLFQYLKIDEVGLFVNLLDLFIKKHSYNKLKILLNLYQHQTGYTLLLASIFYNKNEILENLIKLHGKYIDFNLKSVDGWLPFQLALASQNKKAIDLMVENSHLINLDINSKSEHGQIIFNLINTINIDLIEKIVKKFPITYEDHHQQNQNNVYDFVWNHHRLTQNEKRNLLQLMHKRHLQLFDFYRQDQILYNSCVRYLPEAPRRHSPKKQIIYNPNLKIISGEIIKCKNPAIFSKYFYLSINSYAGAIEQYQINTKINISNDKDKLERYQKKHHLSFQQIGSIELLEQKDKSWFLKKEWYCFVIKQKRDNKTIFACNHEYTANMWVNQIKQAIEAWIKNEHKHYSNKVVKNYIHISDVEFKPPIYNKKKIGSNKLIELFSNRLSLCEPEPVNNQSSLEKQMPMVKSKSQYNTINEIAPEPILQPATTLKFKDFRMVKLLGEGSFGQVFLSFCLKNNKYYALKAFQKKKIILSKQTKFVVSEVNILKQINHPFIIKLYFTFQTPNYIYLGLQYCQGQDLSRHMNQQMMFPQNEVKIYAAQIVLAIEYLHSIGIIYRDLKPQNIMLGKDGHILLVDFGLSKKTENNFAKTFCGSPAYLSPQMIDKQGVGPQSDYFTLGVVIYEFIFGEPPFFSDNIHQLYQNIQNGKIKYPRKIDQATRNFLEALLHKNPKQRLGSRSIEDIKRHPYFKQIDWQKLFRKEIKAPSREMHDPEFKVEDEQQDFINIFHDDFDYSVQNYKINRFKNFSFIREDQFS